MQEYQNIYINILFAKGYAPYCSEEVFVLKKKFKNTVPWTYLIEHLNGKEIVGTFYKKGLHKTNQKQVIKSIKRVIEKVIKRKSQKLYPKWTGYSNSINSWIDKKDIVI